jgi:hypothetical protein
MKAPKMKPIDAAVAVLGSGLLLGIVIWLVESSRRLAGLFGS